MEMYNQQKKDKNKIKTERKEKKKPKKEPEEIPIDKTTTIEDTFAPKQKENKKNIPKQKNSIKIDENIKLEILNTTSSAENLS